MPDHLERTDDEGFRRQYLEHYDKDHVAPEYRRFVDRVSTIAIGLFVLSVPAGALVWQITGIAAAAQAAFILPMALSITMITFTRRRGFPW